MKKYGVLHESIIEGIIKYVLVVFIHAMKELTSKCIVNPAENNLLLYMN
jgi:hypothetical protein